MESHAHVGETDEGAPKEFGVCLMYFPRQHMKGTKQIR